MSKVEFKMPRLGESITEAAIITWFKNVGDTIEEDEMLLEVATDKVDSEVPSNVSGVIEEILYDANAVIKIGETIAIIKTDDKASSSKDKSKKSTVISSEVEKSAQSKTTKKKRTVTPSVAKDSNSFSVSNSNTFFSPLIIKIAKEHHISFEELAPSEQDKPYLYAIDENGNPYSPSWYTLNFTAQYDVLDNLKATATVENITDQRYRTYSSGIAAAGRNLILALSYDF